MIVDFKKAGWKKYIKQIEKLIKLVATDDFHVDHVVCLARGGMLPGDMISRVLNKPLSVMKVSSYGANRKQDSVLKIESFSGEPNITGNILLVDDLCDSGRTMKEVSSYLANHFYNVQEIRGAVIWFKNKGVDNVYIPDYIANDIDEKDWKWVFQPFEYYESVDVERLRSKANKENK